MKRFFSLLFMPCEGITGLVSESFDRDLTRSERVALRLHLTYCRACRRYRRQIRYLREVLATLSEDLAGATDESQGLGPEARARIINALKRE